MKILLNKKINRKGELRMTWENAKEEDNNWTSSSSIVSTSIGDAAISAVAFSATTEVPSDCQIGGTDGGELRSTVRNGFWRLAALACFFAARLGDAR